MKKSTSVQFLIRILVYCLGLLLLAFGVAVSVNSDLGVSPVNSLPYVISRIIHVQLGTCVTAVFCSYIAMQVLILRREFQIINLLQILFSTLFGYFVDFAKLVIGDFALPGYGGRLGMLAESVLLIALGILLYLEAELVPMPMEGLTAAIAKKLNKPFPTMKTSVDCVVVGTGIVLCFVFLGKLDGIREGTVITAVVTGKIIALLRKPLSPVLKKLCFGE